MLEDTNSLDGAQINVDVNVSDTTYPRLSQCSDTACFSNVYKNLKI